MNWVAVVKRGALCLVMALAVMIGLCESRVEARDVWAYTDPQGTQYYVMTETFEKLIGGKYFVDVKLVSANGNRHLNTMKYGFSRDEGTIWVVYKEKYAQDFQRGGDIRENVIGSAINHVLQQYGYVN